MATRLLIDLFFVLLFVVRAWAQCGPYSSSVVGAVGGTVCLSPRPAHQKTYSRIQWRRNDTLKLASWEDDEKKTQYPNTQYKDRLELFSNFSLKISRLQKNDSSSYRLYLEDAAGKEDMDEMTLTVYDLVPKPQVMVMVTRNDQQQCNATLKCLVALEEVTYEWIPPRQILLESAEGPVQKVSFNPSEGTYVCRVSNPASSNNASLTYRHPCSWTGEPSAAASHVATGGLVALGHLLLLFFHLALA